MEIFEQTIHYRTESRFSESNLYKMKILFLGPLITFPLIDA